MNCATNYELVSAYVDGELSPAQATELAEHLASCGSCAAEYQETLTTVRTLREGLVRHQAPDVLRARVRAAIREERSSQTAVLRRSPPVAWRAAAAVAAGVLIAAVSSSLTVLATRGAARGTTIPDEIVASHIRSLMPDHLTDVPSSDQHNVKPWFNGRLDYSPTVPRLDTAGFTLIGGRLDYVGGRPVAAVVYGRRQHVINVFSWPSDPARETELSALHVRHGYNALRWAHDGVQYWAVSDLNGEELRHFAEMVRGRSSPGAGSGSYAP
jgi:anti-sigma factor RsiW